MLDSELDDVLIEELECDDLDELDEWLLELLDDVLLTDEALELDDVLISELDELDDELLCELLDRLELECELDDILLCDEALDEDDSSSTSQGVMIRPPSSSRM